MNKKTDYAEKLMLCKDDRKLTIREMTLQNGLSFPSDEELIMLILGSGTKEMPVRNLAQEVLQIVMSAKSENLVDDLQKIRGMGKTKALKVAAALEFGRRLTIHPHIRLNCPSEVVPYIQSYAMMTQEHFLCVTLTGAREIISIRVICTGSSNMAIITPAEVFSEAIKEHASAVVLSHNHPSGSIQPSDDDVTTTLRLYQAANLLGISLLDHIIITKTGYYSFLENGVIG